MTKATEYTPTQVCWTVGLFMQVCECVYSRAADPRSDEDALDWPEDDEY